MLWHRQKKLVWEQKIVIHAKPTYNYDYCFYIHAHFHRAFILNGIICGYDTPSTIVGSSDSAAVTSPESVCCWLCDPIRWCNKFRLSSPVWYCVDSCSKGRCKYYMIHIISYKSSSACEKKIDARNNRVQVFLSVFVHLMCNLMKIIHAINTSLDNNLSTEPPSLTIMFSISSFKSFIAIFVNAWSYVSQRLDRQIKIDIYINAHRQYGSLVKKDVSLFVFKILDWIKDLILRMTNFCL